MSIEPILEFERKKCSLPIEKLSEFLYGKSFYHGLRAYLEAAPTVAYTPNLYNKSRLELIKDSYKYLPVIQNYNSDSVSKATHPHFSSIYSFLVNPHQEAGSAHIGMFIKYIDLMGTEKHRELYLEKSKRFEIVGCYAQTELGHGSDIRSLETTATFDLKTQEWILNSPTVSSAKYWPGELGIFANYALVFAQTYANGKNQGVYPFIVRIKDDEYNWLPNIEGGDIGPKIGYHAKQNGYMFLRNIRIPKENLLSKYVSVSNDGQIKINGDPRVGYGTMMFIRELITCAFPKIYAQVIIIAARYSLFRSQFTNENKQQIRIIDYQIQQDKIISRIAQYYAVTVAGNRILSISEQNTAKVLKNDFSLLQENHSNLSFSKSLFSQIIHQGIETCRRSLGGHGTSYYSGVPQLLNQYAAHNTHEGENTVMYLQAARYILKSYGGHLLKGKPLSDSVQYIAKFPEISQTKFFGQKGWTIDELKVLLLKSVNHILSLISARLANKEKGETEADIINQKVGMRLQQLAQLHGLYYIVQSFSAAIAREQTQQIKGVLENLCSLFAINQIIRLAEPIVQGGFVCPVRFAQLQEQKEGILKAIRPLTAGLLDSFGIPDKYIRSELVSGNPYQNFLDRARECELNEKISESQIIVSKIKDVLAAKPRL